MLQKRWQRRHPLKWLSCHQPKSPRTWLLLEPCLFWLGPTPPLPTLQRGTLWHARQRPRHPGDCLRFQFPRDRGWYHSCRTHYHGATEQALIPNLLSCATSPCCHPQMDGILMVSFSFLSGPPRIKQAPMRSCSGGSSQTLMCGLSLGYKNLGVSAFVACLCSYCCKRQKLTSITWKCQSSVASGCLSDQATWWDGEMTNWWEC